MRDAVGILALQGGEDVNGWVLPSREIISTLDVPDRFVALFNRLVPELLDFHERVTKGPLAEHATVAQEAKGSLALALCAACALNQRQWIDPIVDACPSALHEWVPSVAITSEFGNDLSYSTAFHALHWGRSDFFKDLVAKGLSANKPPLKVNGPNNSYTHDWAKTLEYTPLRAPPSTVHNALVFLNMQRPEVVSAILSDCLAVNKLEHRMSAHLPSLVQIGWMDDKIVQAMSWDLAKSNAELSQPPNPEPPTYNCPTFRACLDRIRSWTAEEWNEQAPRFRATNWPSVWVRAAENQVGDHKLEPLVLAWQDLLESKSVQNVYDTYEIDEGGTAFVHPILAYIENGANQLLARAIDRGFDPQTVHGEDGLNAIDVAQDMGQGPAVLVMQACMAKKQVNKVMSDLLGQAPMAP